VWAHLWGQSRCGELLALGLSFAGGHSLERFLAGQRLLEPKAVDLRAALLLARQRPLDALALHREAARRGVGQEHAAAREALVAAALGFLPAPALAALKASGLEAAAAVLGTGLAPSPFEADDDDDDDDDDDEVAERASVAPRSFASPAAVDFAQQTLLRSAAAAASQAPAFKQRALFSGIPGRLHVTSPPAQPINPSPGRLFADIPGRASRSRPGLASARHEQPPPLRAPAAPPPGDLFQGITGRVTRARARELR
jgi:hypothetical protein